MEKARATQVSSVDQKHDALDAGNEFLQECLRLPTVFSFVIGTLRPRARGATLPRIVDRPFKR